MIDRVSTLKQIPLYGIDDIVYAIALSNDSKTETGAKADPWDKDFAKIFKVKVTYISIDKDGIQYGVKDALDNADWSDSVSELQISSDPDDLFRYLANRWKI